MQGNTTDVTLTTSLSTPLILGTNNTPRLTISSTGAATFSSSVTANSLLVERSASRNMLGISTISLPTSGSEEGVAVVKTNSNLWQMSLVGYAANSKGMRIYNTGGAGNTSLEVATGDGTSFIVNGTGNVGINCTPTGSEGKLEIVGSNGNLGGGTAKRATTIYSTSAENSDRPGIILGYDTAGGGVIAAATQSSGQPLNFWTYNGSSWGERMRITSGGQLLVGKTTLAMNTSGIELYPNGTSVHSFNVTNNEAVIFNNIATGTSYQIDFRTNTIERGSISVTDSATSYNTSSDYRLKENVKPVENALSVLTQLKPYTFNFIVNPEEEVMGFLAHEVQEVMPQAIKGEKDAVKIEQVEVYPAELDEEGNVITEAVIEEKEVPVYQGIDHSKLVPLLVASIQELKAEIEALKSQING